VPRILKPQAVVNRVGNAINAPSQFLRSKLGIGLLPFSLALIAELLFLGLMILPLFR
jgi:hypothetical protein